MKILPKPLITAILLMLTLVTPFSPARAIAEQLLATVGERGISVSDLESALASSPIGSQLPSMDEDLQAGLRGDMLKRLINAELLTLEARDQGIQDSPEFKRKFGEFRRGLGYQRFIARVREQLTLSAAEQAHLREKFKGDPDALTAARSVGIARRFEPAKTEALHRLRESHHIVRYDDRLNSRDPATVLATVDGMDISLGDLVDLDAMPAGINPAWLRQRLGERIDVELATRSVEQDDADMAAQLDEYRSRLMAEVLLDQKEHEWIPDEQTLRDYYAAHPQLGRIATRWHVGQLVVASPKEAEALRKRILAGESLFELARDYSIDPYGRAHSGDMGWLKEGTGLAQIEAALNGMEDGTVSEVVQSPKGYHLVTVLERKPGEQKAYADIHDRVRRALLLERLPAYMARLRGKYPVQLHLPEHTASVPKELHLHQAQ